MNYNIQLIEQKEVLGRDFRIYGDYKNPLFLAKDVAEMILHSNARMMLQAIDDNEKVKAIYPVNNPYVVSEPNLNQLVSQSREAGYFFVPPYESS